jgi:hypothetical protein
MNKLDSFKAIFANDPAALERWNAFTETAIQKAAQAGISITKEDLATLTSARIFVLTGQESGDWQEEAKVNLPAFRRAAESAQMRAAIADEEAAKHAAATAKLDAMTPEQRMRFARENGAAFDPAHGKEEPKQLTPGEKQAALARINKLRGGAKIAEARRLGLG